MIQDLKTFFANQKDVQLAFAFGSLAANKMRFNSDVDIAILKEEPLTLDERIAFMNELAEVTKTDVDLIDLFFEEGLLLKEVMTTGEILLCQSESALLYLNQRVFSFSEDFEPTYRLMLKQSLFKYSSV